MNCIQLNLGSFYLLIEEVSLSTFSNRGGGFHREHWKTGREKQRYLSHCVDACVAAGCAAQ